MLTVGCYQRFVVVLALIASIGATGLAACTGEPETAHAQMACCKAMGTDCPMHKKAADCCKTGKNSHQGGALMASPAMKLLGGMASTTVVFAPIAPSMVDPFQRITTSAPSDRHKPHSPPPSLRHIPLLI